MQTICSTRLACIVQVVEFLRTLDQSDTFLGYWVDIRVGRTCATTSCRVEKVSIQAGSAVRWEAGDWLGSCLQLSVSGCEGSVGAGSAVCRTIQTFKGATVSSRVIVKIEKLVSFALDAFTGNVDKTVVDGGSGCHARGVEEVGADAKSVLLNEVVAAGQT